MFIESARIKNFGIIAEEEFSFSSGINMFYGENGEGKSTVLKALAMLIFNQYTGKIADYIRWDHEEEGFDISSNFSHQNIHYLIEYTYTEKKSNKKLTNLDTKESYDNSAVSEYLNDLFDMKRAVASVISFENNIDLISTSPAERREYLKGIYDLNFKEKLKSIEEELTLAKEDILISQQKILILEGLDFEKLQLIRKPFSETIYEQYLIDTKDLRDEIISKKQRKIDIEKLERNVIIKERALRNEKVIKEEISDLIDSLDFKKSKLEKQLADFGEFSTVKLDEEKTYQTNIINTKLYTLRQDRILFTEKLENLEEPKVDLAVKNNLKDYEKNIIKLTMDIAREEKELETFKSGKCPTCGKPVDSSFIEKTQDHLEKDSDILASDKKAVIRFKTTREEERQSQLKYEENKREIERKIVGIESDTKEQLQAILFLDERTQNKIDRARNDFDQDLNEIKNNISRSEDRKELQESKLKQSEKAIDDIKDEIEFAELAVKKNPFNPEDILELEKRLSEIITKTDSYYNVLATNEEKKRQNKETARKEEERDLSVKELKVDLEKNHEIESITILAKKILSKEFPSFVISRMIESLKMYVNEFLAKVYPKYELDLKENKSSLRVLFGPKSTDVKLASGFEQQIFSFAWKYALGKIQNYGLLMLDEVDSAASVENSERFYNTLAKMDDYFKQVFVISHKPEIQELLSTDYQATIYSVEDGVYSRI